MHFLFDATNRRYKASYDEIGGLSVNGFKVIEVPDYVEIDYSDVDVSDTFEQSALVRQKYEGILADEPTYDFILYDDLYDTAAGDPTDAAANEANEPVFDTAFAQTRAGYGVDTYWLPPVSNSENGLLQTNTLDVSADGSFARFQLHWDAFQITRNRDGQRAVLNYSSVDPDTLNVSISNDGGSTFTNAFFMEQVVLAASDNQLVVRFENSTSNRIYLGGFAILY